MATVFRFSDAVPLWVGAPSIFGAINQVQQLAAQRAQAEALGRESWARAVERAADIARAERARQRELQAALAMAQLQAMNKEREQQRAMQKEQALREQEFALAALEQNFRDLWNSYQHDIQTAPALVKAQHDEIRRQYDAERSKSLDMLERLVTTGEIVNAPSQAAELVKVAKIYGVDDNTLSLIIDRAARVAEKYASDYREALEFSETANKILNEELGAILKNRKTTTPIDTSYGSWAPTNLRRKTEQKEVVPTEQDIDLAMASTYERLAKRYGNRPRAANYVRFEGGQFKVALPPPPDPTALKLSLQKAAESVKPVEKPSAEKIFKDVEQAREEVERRYRPVFDTLNAIRLQIAYGNAYPQGYQQGYQQEGAGQIMWRPRVPAGLRSR